MRSPLPHCALVALQMLALPAVGRAASVTASAYSYEQADSETHPTQAGAFVTRQGTDMPGSGSGLANAACGALSGVAIMTGCGVNAPFQQVCNNANANASFADLITILADAPNGTPVEVRATLDLWGHIDGTGGYFYQVNGVLYTQGRGWNGSTGGTVQTIDDLSLNNSQSWTVNLAVGGSYNISGSVQTQVLNRICATGTGSCEASVTTWTMSLVAETTLRLEILTPLPNSQIVSESGHDYLASTVGVAPSVAAPAGLGPAWPNPSRGSVNLAISLASDSPVDVGVFDLAGRRVATLARGTLPAGTRTLTWDGRDADGRALAGMYFVRASGHGVGLTRRVMVIR